MTSGLVRHRQLGVFVIGLTGLRDQAFQFGNARAAIGAGFQLRPEFRRGFEYSDCWVDDARLVILNLIDAAGNGAKVLPRTRALRAQRANGSWLLEMQSADGTMHVVRARALVNAAGPWVQDVTSGVAGQNSAHSVRLVKGSHLVLPKFWDGPQAYLFKNHDKRVIFVNPYETDLCLIGTTDVAYAGAAEDVAIDDAEIDYLLAAVNRYVTHELRRADVRYTFSGVRPLYDDNAANPSAVTRDYVFDRDGGTARAPLLSVFGGKITTYRRLAEHAIAEFAAVFPRMGGAWTAGGDRPSFLDRYGVWSEETVRRQRSDPGSATPGGSPQPCAASTSGRSFTRVRARPERFRRATVASRRTTRGHRGDELRRVAQRDDLDVALARRQRDHPRADLVD